MHRESANRPANPSSLHHFVPFSNRTRQPWRYRDRQGRRTGIKKTLADNPANKAKKQTKPYKTEKTPKKNQKNQIRCQIKLRKQS